MPKISRASGNNLHFWCPGCDMAHGVNYGDPKTDGYVWVWNEDVELPTISPSILVMGGTDNVRCHSFVVAGSIRFLSDCTHTLAGRTVDLPNWPNV